MKKYIVGKWYFIDYNNKRYPDRSFIGPAELMDITIDGYWFYSPLSNHKEGNIQMLFSKSHIKHEVSPLPSYMDLYSQAISANCPRILY